MAVVGECKLCKSKGVELQDSHIIPKWAYKRVRDLSPVDSNPNPVVISDGRATQISKQVKEHLLCSRCEQVFSRFEEYISNITYANDGTPVPLQILNAQHRTSSSDKDSAYLAIDALDLEQIKLFVVSVVWRMHVANCLNSGGLSLGDKYAEGLRLYLLGQQSFPKNVRIGMVVLDQPKGSNNPVHNVVAFPVTKKENGFHRHAFYICGLFFELFLGNRIPSSLTKICLHHGTNKGAGLFRADEIGILSSMAGIARSATPIGKLSKR